MIVEPVRRGVSATNPNGKFAALVFTRSDRPFTDDERTLALELARRAGLAAEHARLFAAAELATRERERLLAVVAHDLRNPLGVVAMYAEMLKSLQPDPPGTPLSPAQAEYTNAALSTIHRTTQGMQSLVEDLLDATTLRDGAFKLHLSEHDPRELLDRMVELLTPLAQARGMRLEVQAPQTPQQPHVRADAGRLLQVLSNLVGNAIKFSPPDATIVLRWSPTSDALDFEVVDQGDGIASDELPHLFTAFWQGKKHNMRGAGLGLWIARAIVEGHGGTIAAESTPGAGATFRVTLPYEATIRRWED